MAYAMKELDEHNHLLGDPAALNRVFEEEGYLYFRDVLDKDAVAAVREKYFSVLVNDYGVVDPGETEPVWNGNDVSNFPVKVPEVYGSGTYERFVENPAINEFFEGVVGEPISWIPSTEYRLNPPVAEAPEDQVAGRHQDGFFNNGYNFRICWIPFADIDEEMGGITIAPKAHKRGYLHDAEDAPKFPIPAGAVADDEWARPKVYRAGDVLMFGTKTPHSGLANLGKAFRLSMDVRFSTANDPQPVCGDLTEVTKESITLGTSVGPIKLVVDEDTYLRLKDGARLPNEEIETLLNVGDSLMVGAQDGRAVLIRPQKG
jgi:hypothetical protein